MAIESHYTAGFTAIPSQVLLRDGTPDTTVMTGPVTLTTKSGQLLSLDPGGATRVVTLPTAKLDIRGLAYLLVNAADADGEDLTISDGSTVVTLSRYEMAIVWCDGADWVTSGAIGGAGQLSLTGSAAGTGEIVVRVGATSTEGLELRVYEETVTPSAVETNLLNTPAGAVLLSVQANVETALTGGGTTVTWAIGIAADPDKYGYPGSDTLLQNGKVDTIPAHAVLAAAEQMLLTGAATGGTADGDTALTVGSVRVRIVYWALNSLDDA